MEVEHEYLDISMCLYVFPSYKSYIHLYRVSWASEAAFAQTSGVVVFSPEVADSLKDRPNPAKKILFCQ
jgi:hypothetical protein